MQSFSSTTVFRRIKEISDNMEETMIKKSIKRKNIYRKTFAWLSSFWTYDMSSCYFGLLGYDKAVVSLVKWTRSLHQCIKSIKDDLDDSVQVANFQIPPYE